MTEAFLTSDSQTWATPWSFMDFMKEIHGWQFTLDVCAMPTSRKAPLFYTEEKDSFKQNWGLDAAGGDAWCNPPYAEYMGKSVGDWAQKAWSYRGTLNSALLLPCNKTDQDWYHDLVVPDGQYQPVRGRIQFVDPVTGLRPPGSGSNSQGSMVCAFGPRFQGPMAPKPLNYREWKKRYKEGNVIC
jgi:site-specific DNA-methyltransferase (adenine-specific)